VHLIRADGNLMPDGPDAKSVIPEVDGHDLDDPVRVAPCAVTGGWVELVVDSPAPVIS